MKTLKIIFVFAILAIFTSCSKNDDETPITQNPEVNPLEGYLVSTGFNERTVPILIAPFSEFGLSFKPLVNGKITAVVVKIPDVNGALRVTIWNKTTATILKSEIINYTTAGVEVAKAIDPIHVIAGTEYMVTYNTDNWYIRYRTDGHSISYPVTVGDIRFTGFWHKSGTGQQLPNMLLTAAYNGDLSFKFQKS